MNTTVVEVSHTRPGRRLWGTLTVECSGDRHPETAGRPFRMALEVSVLAGFEMWAYLVVERVPSRPDAPLIAIDVPENPTNEASSPRRFPVGDGVEQGLPREYRAAVLEALHRYAAVQRVPMKSGLRVIGAAHAYMGSNQIIFARTAWTAATLLCTPLVQHGAELYDRLLREILKPLPGQQR